jgi:hypothetical protein
MKEIKFLDRVLGTTLLSDPKFKKFGNYSGDVKKK